MSVLSGEVLKKRFADNLRTNEKNFEMLQKADVRQADVAECRATMSSCRSGSRSRVVKIPTADTEMRWNLN
jgi:hypothetical protein